MFFMYRLCKIFIFLIIGLLISSNSYGEHLVGGDISYRYIRTIGNNVEYEVTVTIFRDCSASSPTPFDNSIEVGFYETTGTRRLVRDETIFLTREILVDPLLGGSVCDFTPNTCLRQGLYIKRITVPRNSNGYHLRHIRCCRNDITNAPEFEGMSFYAFIRSTDDNNTAPSFSDVPSPYFCSNDTIFINTSGSESNNDKLVYKLVRPYSGGDENDPKPANPGFFNDPPLMRYNNGFNESQPFGNNGVCEIDENTGILKMFIPNGGKYVIAVEIEEYRNGVLIGRTRRDIQLIVLNCPPNPAPKRLVNANTGLQTRFDVFEGEDVSFLFTFEDNNQMKFRYSGEVFQPGFPNPATFQNTADGTRIEPRFNWKPSCGSAREQPYVVTMTLEDEGCPPKESVFNILIYVNPVVTPDPINGPNTVCAENETYIYSINNPQNQTLTWTVVGGDVVRSDNQSIEIRWRSNRPVYEIRVRATSGEGCEGELVTFPILKVVPPLVKPEILGPRIICFNDEYDYRIGNPVINTTYNWLVTNAETRSATNQNNVKIFSNSEQTIQLGVYGVSEEGCFSDTTFIEVEIDNPNVDEIKGALSVCPNAKNIDYVVNPRFGSRYVWKVENALSFRNLNSSGSTIDVNWGERGTGKVKVVEISQFGCESDTVEIEVWVDYTLITPPIEGDTVACEQTSNITYEVPFVNNSRFEWAISGGTITNGDGTHKVEVSWGIAGTGTLTCQEFAYDSVNNQECIGIPVSLNVRVAPTPNPSPIVIPNVTCEADTLTFSTTGFAGSTFVWSVDNQNVEILNQGQQSILAIFPIEGSYIISVQELSADSCESLPISSNITIHPKPETSFIVGPTSVCAPDTNNIVYSVSGFANSVFNWNISEGRILSGQGTNSIIVSWNTPGVQTLSVIETTEFGCEDSVRILEVKVDAPYIEIKRVSTVLFEPEKIVVEWVVENDTFFDGKFQIFRAEDFNNDYVLIAEADKDARSFIDEFVETQEHNYFYRIEMINICGDVVTNSHHKSILLNGRIAFDTIINVDWNAYEGWDRVDEYTIYRRENDEKEFKEMASFRVPRSTDVSIGFEGYKQCFIVKSVQYDITNPAVEDDSLVSYSNEVCFFFEPILWIPNAFTPNDDFDNETFRVVAGHFREYNIQIYNRWGQRIFESDHPSKQWDGTFKNKQVQEGAYLYVVTVNGYRNHIIRKGVVHVYR